MADRDAAVPGHRVELVCMSDFARIRTKALGSPPPNGSVVLNIERMWARNPALMKAQRPLQEHLLFQNSVPDRERELAILRIGWNCRARYEFAQHTVFGREAGLTEDEIRRVIVGPDAPAWTAREAAVLRATDEMYADQAVSGPTWDELASHFSAGQLIDLLSLVGRYWTVSVVLNTTGVPLEEDRESFPGHEEWP